MKDVLPFGNIFCHTDRCSPLAVVQVFGEEDLRLELLVDPLLAIAQLDFVPQGEHRICNMYYQFMMVHDEDVD